MSFWSTFILVFLSYQVKKYWMGKSDNAASCCYYCILHQTIAWEKLLKYCAWLSRSNKMFICWKKKTKVCFTFLCIVLFGAQRFLSAHPWRWSQLGNRNLRIKLCGNDNDSSLNFHFDPQLHPWSFAVHMYYVISLLTSVLLRYFFGLHWFRPTRLKSEDVVLGKLSPQDKKM